MTGGGDETARRTVREALDAGLQVTAGAGTGKTHELVTRIAALVARGEPIAGTAVITFTEKAAAELRERVRATLEGLATDATVGDAVRDRVLAALGALDDATICTLHAFARRILDEAPYATGVTPGFEVLDEVGEQAERDRWWRRTSVRMHEDPELERPLVALAAACGVRTRQLRELADALIERREHLSSTTATTPPVVPTLETGPLVTAIERITARRTECLDPADPLAAHLERLARWAAEVTAGDELTRLRLLATVRVSSTIGRKHNWPDGAKTEIVADLGVAETERLRALDRVLVPAAQAVTVWLARAVADGAAQRAAAGRLTYHDLLVLAATALRRDSDLRRRLARRWPRILIDEFQDTDPLQLELAVRLAAEDQAAASGPWTDVPLRPGALFVVGDPQQSIYRFRRADIGLYRQTLDRLGASRVHLARNHRSRPGILAWVNTVFGALLEDDGTGLQVPHRDLEAHLPPDPRVPVPVRVLGGPVGSDGPARAAAVREREAAALVDAARLAVSEGWPVRAEPDEPDARPDGAGGHVRPARFGDIAVLMPTRLMLRPLEAAFEAAGLPLRVECQSLLWATPEVTDLARVLRAVADPGDRLALVAALRTPAFGCSDRALAEYRSAGGRWSIHADAPPGLPPGHPVAVALGRLRDLADRARFLSADEAVEAAVRELRLLHLATFTRRPRDGWRRLRHVVATARSFAAGAAVTLRDFVDWVDAQADAVARVDEAVVTEPDDDAVRVFTVHGAKGLEFPIVLLTGLGSMPRRTTRRAIVGPLGVEVSLGRAPSGGRGPERSHHRVRTPGFEAADAREAAAEAAEELRLWYVAATRARDHLVVGCHHTGGGDNERGRGDRDTSSFAARLWRLHHSRPLPWTSLAPAPGPADGTTGEPSGAASVPPPGRDARPGVAERDAWWSAREVRLARAARPVRSATALGAHGPAAAHPAPEPGDDTDPDRPPWRRGRAATARGRAVHAVLQTIDLRRGGGIEAAARAQAEAEAVGGEAARIARLADAARRAPAVQAAAAGRHWREVPVAVTVDGVLVEGYIDLLAEQDDGSLVVIDYKTDTLDGARPQPDRLAAYRSQLATYAVALEAVTGRTVSGAVLVFARDDRPALEHRIDDLRVAMAEVRAGLAAHRDGVGPAGLEPATHGL